MHGPCDRASRAWRSLYTCGPTSISSRARTLVRLGGVLTGAGDAAHHEHLLHASAAHSTAGERRRALELLLRARRPLILAGGGVICSEASAELAAFAGHVIAHPDTTIRLPEVSMGLIPGAGGTVSLPRRIGRHRTALLALSQAPIDAPTAASWGRIDAID